MPIATQNLFSNPRSHLYSHSLRPPINLPQNPSHFQILGIKKHISTPKLESFVTNHRWRLRVFESNQTVEREGPHKFNWDLILSIAEFLCIVPCAILSIGCASNFSSQKSFMFNRVLVWQHVLLVAAVFIGGLIRRRQWERISFKSGVSNLDLIGRIDKLEEDLRSSTTIIRVLSRQLEKLGIRFRVTRKSLKEPISEAVALAQKNTEATHALEMQKEILEKELGEIQKVLLAMQEQQQKQFELILAIGKAGKLREIKKESVVERTTGQLNSVAGNKEGKQIEAKSQTGSRQKGSNNDSA